jgi:uncharacterized protein YpuA (DUF1002 family)
VPEVIVSVVAAASVVVVVIVLVESALPVVSVAESAQENITADKTIAQPQKKSCRCIKIGFSNQHGGYKKVVTIKKFSLSTGFPQFHKAFF